MKTYLLPKNGKFYKTNMHCHTIMSDGNYTPEQIKEIYKNKGYSVVAYTDHNLFLDRSSLCDKDFIALNGFEIDVAQNTPHWLNAKANHLCMIALSPDNLITPCYHRSKYLYKNAENYRDQIKFDTNKPDFERIYTPDCINTIIKECHDSGFFVTYNHPAWSRECYTDYIKYKGMDAMEIFNYGSWLIGYNEYNTHAYTDFLDAGTRLYCVGGDDNHNYSDPDNRKFDSFGAFTMIKAEKLDYTTITDALVKGNFYASEGPEIYDLYYENETVHLICSPVDRIQMNTGARHARAYYDETGDGLTHAEFCVNDPVVNYVRFTIIDKHGKRACTNAYYYKDIVK